MSKNLLFVSCSCEPTMFKLREICNVAKGAFHLDITAMNSGETTR